MVGALKERQVMGPEIAVRNPAPVLRAVQKNILLHRSFMNFDGQRHEGLYLRSGEIISLMAKLLHGLSPLNTKTERNAKSIIKKGWVPIVGDDPNSKENRRIAMKHLLTLSNIAQSSLKITYQKGKMPDWEFKTLIEPTEGVRLTALRELEPEKFGSIARIINQKQN